MPTPTNHPANWRPSDHTAQAQLDDDGNPLRPLEAPADTPGAVIAAVTARPLLAVGLACAAGMLAARWSTRGA